MDISKRVFGSNVSEKIRNYINKLQEGTFDIEPGDEVSVNFDTETYLGERTPYSRMWTSVQITKLEKGFKLNEAGEAIFGSDIVWNKIEDPRNIVFSINENRNKSYEELESMESENNLKYEYINELANNPLLKPVAGIKSINSKSEGSLGALRRTTVEFVVHNKEDFETIYLPHFLKPGANVFLDFGWSDKAFSLYNPENTLHTYDDSEMKKFWEDIIQKREDSIEGGFQTTIAGNVVKYDVNVDQQGSFNCTLEMVSGNYRLLDKSVSDDNDLKFIFDNHIEELLLNYYVSLSGINVSATDLVNLQENKAVTTEEKQKTVRDIFDRGAKLSSGQGLLNTTAKKTGIFWQQESEGTLTDKETLYISFGLLEDKFLNNFISLWITVDDKSKEISTQDKTDKPFTPSFTSINSYIRYDEDLFKMMGSPYQEGDEIISFLYPDSWLAGGTYNKFKPVGWEDAGGLKNDKEKRRIPLREVFISVPLISEAFKQSENVNDALEFIFNQIYEDSGNIINIKLISPNDAQSAITFTDVNVEMDRFSSDDDQKDQTLKFDLTSGNTIVQSFDLKFETPKAGLSSMIAIGNLKQPTVFDELELMKFNLLNTISGQGVKYQIQHLPTFDNMKSKKGALTLQLDKFLADNDNTPSEVEFDSKLYNEYKEKTKQKEADVTTSSSTSYYSGTTQSGEVEVEETTTTTTEFTPEYQGQGSFTGEEGVEGGGGETRINLWGGDGLDSITKTYTNTEKIYHIPEVSMPDQTELGEPIFYAESDRHLYLLRAKVENFIKSNTNSISPVMPISLSLKVYGNNFLGMGDFFTVNYLPKHYQERVIFQIVGVDHTMDTSGWSTNYTTVMRLKPTMKYTQFSDNKADENIVHIRFHDLYKEKLAEQMQNGMSDDNANHGAGALISDIKPDGESTIEVDPKILKDNNLQNSDMPKTTFKREIFTLDPVGKKKEFEEKLKELGSKKVNKYKWPLAEVNLKDMVNYRRLRYWIDISSLILSDKLIDWEKVQKDYKETGTPLVLNQSKTPKLWNAGINDVYITSRIDTQAKEEKPHPHVYSYKRNSSWDSKVLKLYDDVLWEIREAGGLDTMQAYIDMSMFTQEKNETSPFLRFKDDADNTRYNSKEVGNVQLFHYMTWAIPQDGPSEWIRITVQGLEFSETDVLPSISLPKKYLKVTGDSFDEVTNKWVKSHVVRRANKKIEEQFTKKFYDDK